MRAILLIVGMVVPVVATDAQDSFLGKNAVEWARQLKTSKTPGERRNAAYALGKMGEGTAAVLPDIKAAAAAETHPQVRESLVYALGEISRHCKEDGDIERIFLDALCDDDPLVRRSAAFALGCSASKSAEVRAALDTAVGDSHPAVRQNAAWALGKIAAALGKTDGAVVLGSLRKALGDRDSLVKRDAAGALLSVQDLAKAHELAPDLLPLCRDANSEVRRAALAVLVRLVTKTDQRAVAALSDSLRDTDLENRRNAALALSNIGGPEAAPAVPVLLDAIRNGDLELRRQAVVALHNIGPAAATALDDLMRILETDRDDKIRAYAALSLGGLGKKAEPAVSLLVRTIQHAAEAHQTRLQCATALARMGAVPAADPIMLPLWQFVANPKHESYERQLVIWALRAQLGGKFTKMDHARSTLVKVLQEPRGGRRHVILRYECAYSLGFFWAENAPEIAVDVLSEKLFDDNIKFLNKADTGVGGSSAETLSGKATVKIRAVGDSRVGALEALERVGLKRFASRPEIMKQLRVLAADEAGDEPLRKMAAAMLKAAAAAK